MNTSDPGTFPQKLSTRLGNPHFNLYLVRGTHGSALIEVGVSAIVDAVINQLNALGTAPDYLVVTHPHADHLTGLSGLLNAFPKAVTIFGEGAIEFMSHPKALPGMIKEDAFIGNRLSDLGIQKGRPPIRDMVTPENRQVVKTRHEIDLGGTTLKLFPVKGHSPGGLAAELPEENALIVSDALGFHYSNLVFCPMFFTGFNDYIATLDQLAALKPDILGPGHHGPFTGKDVERAFAGAQEAAVKFVERIRTNEKDGEQLARDLFDEYYREGFSLYTETNILGCMQLLVRRALEAAE